MFSSSSALRCSDTPFPGLFGGGLEGLRALSSQSLSTWFLVPSANKSPSSDPFILLFFFFFFFSFLPLLFLSFRSRRKCPRRTPCFLMAQRGRTTTGTARREGACLGTTTTATATDREEEGSSLNKEEEECRAECPSEGEFVSPRREVAEEEEEEEE